MGWRRRADCFWVICAMFACATLSAAWCELESLSELTTADSRKQETSLGNLVADAIKQAAGTSIAVFPAGSFRDEATTIPAGRITVQDVLKCLQYPQDKIAIIEITGDQLIKALERSVSIYPQENRDFLQVSGIKVQVNPNAIKGARIIRVTIDGKQIQPDQKYRVAMTKPLAEGGQGYFTVWGKGLKPVVTNKTVSSAVEDFLANKTSIDYRKLDRIEIRKGN